jgi:hypothetical protein
VAQSWFFTDIKTFRSIFKHNLSEIYNKKNTYFDKKFALQIIRMLKVKVKSSSLKLNRRACQLAFLCKSKLHLYCAGEK